MCWNTDNNTISFFGENNQNPNDFWRSRDAENSALHHRNKLYFTLYLNKKQLY